MSRRKNLRPKWPWGPFKNAEPKAVARSGGRLGNNGCVCITPATKAFNNRARRLFTYDTTRPVHFTAPINAFSVSSDGQQQPSTPLFGSGAWPLMPTRASTPISTRQPVIGAPLNRSVSLKIIDMGVRLNPDSRTGILMVALPAAQWRNRPTPRWRMTKPARLGECCRTKCVWLLGAEHLATKK
jgi:hypothetical protein